MYTYLMYHQSPSASSRPLSCHPSPVYLVDVPLLYLQSNGSELNASPIQSSKDGQKNIIQKKDVQQPDGIDPQARTIPKTVSTMALYRKAFYSRSQRKNGQVDNCLAIRRIRL